jgi:hypothetical protein
LKRLLHFFRFGFLNHRFRLKNVQELHELVIDNGIWIDFQSISRCQTCTDHSKDSSIDYQIDLYSSLTTLSILRTFIKSLHPRICSLKLPHDIYIISFPHLGTPFTHFPQPIARFKMRSTSFLATLTLLLLTAPATAAPLTYKFLLHSSSTLSPLLTQIQPSLHPFPFL